jgi:hypothetical protein
MAGSRIAHEHVQPVTRLESAAEGVPARVDVRAKASRHGRVLIEVGEPQRGAPVETLYLGSRHELHRSFPRGRIQEIPALKTPLDRTDTPR